MVDRIKNQIQEIHSNPQRADSNFQKGILKNWKVASTNCQGSLLYNKKKDQFKKQKYRNWVMMVLNIVLLSPILYMQGFKRDDNEIYNGLENLLDKTTSDMSKIYDDKSKEKLLKMIQSVNNVVLEDLAQKYHKKNARMQENAIRTMQKRIGAFLNEQTHVKEAKNKSNSNEDERIKLLDNLINELSIDQNKQKENDHNLVENSPHVASAPTAPAIPTAPAAPATLTPGQKKQKLISKKNVEIKKIKEKLQDLNEKIEEIVRMKKENESKRRKVKGDFDRREKLRKDNETLKKYDLCLNEINNLKKEQENLKAKEKSLEKAKQYLEEAIKKEQSGKVTILQQCEEVEVEAEIAKLLKAKVQTAIEENEKKLTALETDLNKKFITQKSVAKTKIEEIKEETIEEFTDKLKNLGAQLRTIWSTGNDLESKKLKIIEKIEQLKKKRDAAEIEIEKASGKSVSTLKKVLKKKTPTSLADLAAPLKASFLVKKQNNPTVEDLLQSLDQLTM